MPAVPPQIDPRPVESVMLAFFRFSPLLIGHENENNTCGFGNRGSLAVSSASAATMYQLDATHDFNSFTPFTITFDDFDADMLFSLDELLAFSGTQANFGGLSVFDELTAVPDAAEFADGAAASWGFAQSGGASTGTSTASNFTYQLAEFPAAVPLPATSLLLLAGLGGLAAFKRRTRG